MNLYHELTDLENVINTLEEIQESLECDLYSIKGALKQLRKMAKKEKAPTIVSAVS